MHDSDGYSETPTSTVNCPECGQELAVTLLETPQLVQCPECEGEFVVPALDGTTGAEPPLENESAPGTQSELDGLRVRQIVMARRAAIRSRTYMLLGAMLCAVGCAKLITMTIPVVRQEGWSRAAIAYAVFAALAVVGALYCVRRAAEFNAESKAGPLPEPATPPDFSTLSDGSQHARNLQDIR
jgi:hypothetical protein